MIIKTKRINLQLFADEGVEPENTPEPKNVPENIPENTEPNIPDNQSGDTNNTPDTPSEPTTDDEVIPKSKVSEIVQKRVNELNEKYKGLERYKQITEKLLQISGLTEEQFFTQLEQIELQRQAQQMGVSPQVAKQIQESKKAAELAQKQAMDMKYAMEEQQLKQNPLYEDYDKVKDNVREFANKTQVSLEQAYWALYGKQLVEKQTKMAEYRVKHNQQYKQDRSYVEIDGDKTSKAPGATLNDEQLKIAKQLGMTPDEYAIWADDNLDYDKAREIIKRR